MIPLEFLSKYSIICKDEPNLTMHEQPRRSTLFSIPVLSAANKYISLLFASLNIGNSGFIHLSIIELNIVLAELSAWFESAQLVGNIKS